MPRILCLLSWVLCQQTPPPTPGETHFRDCISRASVPRVSGWIWPKRTSGKWRVAEDRWGCHFSQLSGACGIPRSTHIRQCCSTWGRGEITLPSNCFRHVWLSLEAGSRPVLSHLRASGQVAPCSLNFSATALVTSLHPAHICEPPYVDLLPGNRMSGPSVSGRPRAGPTLAGGDSGCRSAERVAGARGWCALGTARCAPAQSGVWEKQGEPRLRNARSGGRLLHEKGWRHSSQSLQKQSR